jgi:glycosyltransferase involved in cell wall biosynthesis
MNISQKGCRTNSSSNMIQDQGVEDIEKVKLLYTDADLLDKFEIGQVLYKRYKESGNISASVALLNELKELKPSARFIERELQINLDKTQLLHDSNYFVKHPNPTSQNFKIPLKVLHVLNTSIPYVKNGYSIRSKYIIENQKKYGIEPVVLTRPGFPNDFEGGSLNSHEDLILEWENEIPYYRCLPQMIMRYTPLRKYLKEYSEKIANVIEDEMPGIVHAASNYVNGLAAFEATRVINIPFIYEIRGFWELTASSKIPLFKDSEEFQLAQKMETFLAYHADQVITICRGLRDALVARGVDGDKIWIIPNGVDSGLFKPKPVNEELSAKYGTKNKFVLGYIGSITKYEGLQMLLPVMDEFKKAGYNLKLIIVGTGNYRPVLERLVTGLNLSEEVVFVDHIHHSQVTEYYSLFDLCVFPRIDLEVTRMVTPLKPLEAMACGKPIIGSELEAIKEIITSGETGLLFDLTERDLFQKIKLLYENHHLRTKLTARARKWVTVNRDWYKLAGTYNSLYQQMVKDRRNYFFLKRGAK